MPIDMGSIAAAVTSLKTATDIAKSLIDLSSAAERQSKVIELQRIILQAQDSALSAKSDQSVLLQRIGQLEAQAVELEAWGNEKQKYQLEQVFSGAFAYVLKKQEGTTEPEHWLCTACYSKNRKSLLQAHGRDNSDKRMEIYKCPDCKAQIRVFYTCGPGKKGEDG